MIVNASVLDLTLYLNLQFISMLFATPCRSRHSRSTLLRSPTSHLIAPPTTLPLPPRMARSWYDMELHGNRLASVSSEMECKCRRGFRSKHPASALPTGVRPLYRRGSQAYRGQASHDRRAGPSVCGAQDPRFHLRHGGGRAQSRVQGNSCIC